MANALAILFCYDVDRQRTYHTELEPSEDWPDPVGHAMALQESCEELGL